MNLVAERKGVSVGDLLRAWRAKRRLSQLEVGLTAGVSARHLSFIETGRARASAELLVALADVLDMPLRDRNTLLLAAGFAPRYSETELAAPGMAALDQAITRVLGAHDPYPGVALDRHWNVVIANAAAKRLLSLLPPDLVAATPHNLFRLSLHPRGIAAFTSNFDDWGRYLLRELQRLADESIDPSAAALLEEMRAYPNVQALLRTPAPPPAPALLVPCVLELDGVRLSLFTTLATIGAPRDVTVSELTVELFYPADAATEAALRAANPRSP